MKYIEFTFAKKHKHSGFHILPMLILNISYKKLTFALFIYVFEITLNTFNCECYNCGNLCKNKKEADNHCLENF